jgi:hypothetical protein
VASAEAVSALETRLARPTVDRFTRSLKATAVDQVRKRVAAGSRRGPRRAPRQARTAWASLELHVPDFATEPPMPANRRAAELLRLAVTAEQAELQSVREAHGRELARGGERFRDVAPVECTAEASLG